VSGVPSETLEPLLELGVQFRGGDGNHDSITWSDAEAARRVLHISTCLETATRATIVERLGASKTAILAEHNSKEGLV
jgi:hypothetical protein